MPYSFPQISTGDMVRSVGCSCQKCINGAGLGPALMPLFASCAAVIALLSFKAMAADVPNIVGTWTLSKTPASLAETVKILRQDRDSFSGTIVGPKGKPENILGAFRRDAKTFVYSSDKSGGTGRIQGNEIEICRTDTGCSILTRSK